MHQTKQKGFTLIELLVVIAIIGILSTLAVVALNSARQKSRDSKRTADIKQIQTALELYFNDEHGYPVASAPIALGDADQGTTCNALPGAVCGALCTGGFKTACDSGDVSYMGLLPKAPLPVDGVDCQADSPGLGTSGFTYIANDYVYNSTGTLSDGGAPGYTIDFCLGAQVGALIAGVHQGSQDGIN